MGIFIKAYENNINDNILKINLEKIGTTDATSISNKYVWSLITF